MSVTFELPFDIEQGLRRAIGDLGQAAKEATLVELYRQQRINQSELARSLNLSRLECENLLKQHKVTEDLVTEAEYGKALARLGTISGK
jgi:hypothetical protein